MPKWSKQSTLKGRQWRHGVVYLMLLLAGLIDSADHTVSGPTAREWMKFSKKRKRKAGAADTVPAEAEDSLTEGEDGDDDDVRPDEKAYTSAYGDKSPREPVL